MTFRITNLRDQLLRLVSTGTRSAGELFGRLQRRPLDPSQGAGGSPEPPSQPSGEIATDEALADGPQDAAGVVALQPPWRGFPASMAAMRRLPGAMPKHLRLLITCLSLGFVMAALLGHGRQMLRLGLDVQGWYWLTLAVGLQGLSLLVNGLAWSVILRWRGIEPQDSSLVSLYVSSNLRKYLPGGIWHLATRVQALRQPGAPLQGEPLGTAQALVVTLLDPLLAASAALLLVLFGGWQNGLMIVCLLPLLLLHPRWLQPLLLRLERQRARQLGLSQSLEQELASGSEAAAAQLTSYPWWPLLAELLFVLLRFAGFLCCVWAFDLQQSLDVWIWLAGFALAWTVGLVVPGAPGGLGVFEAVLLLRLGVVLPQSSLLAVALSYRLVVTLADVLTAGLVSADGRRPAPGRSSQ